MDWCSWTDGHSVVRGQNTQDMAPGDGSDQHRQRCKTDRGLDRREEVRSDNPECGVCFCRWLSKAVAEDLPLQTDMQFIHSFIHLLLYSILLSTSNAPQSSEDPGTP
jgi:hypothetical protein